MLNKRNWNGKSYSQLNKSLLYVKNQSIPELEESVVARKDKLEGGRKYEELVSKIIFLEEKLKTESKWRESYLSEISGAEKRIKQSQFYAYSLENRVKNMKKKVDFYKSKYLEAENKLVHLKEYLKKAKLLIENSDIAMETMRSTKFAILQTLKSLFSEEKPNALKLNYAELTDEFTFPLKKILKLYPNIENLQLEGNLITDAGAKTISEAITSLPLSLKTINLNFNLITPTGAWLLIRSIASRQLHQRTQSLNRFQELSLSYNKFENYNDLFIKAWDYLDSTTSNIRSVFDKKYILQADPKILTKTFERLAENYENTEIKEVLFALLKVNIESPKPVNPYEELFLLPGNTNRVFESFQQLFPDELKDGVKKVENSFDKGENLLSNLKKVKIEEVLLPGNSNYAKIVEGLVEKGFDLNSFDENLKETLLMHACRTGNFGLVQVLCKKKVDLEVKNVRAKKENGENAFLMACRGGKFDCAEFLLSKGANPYSCDNKKRTVMHLAVIEGSEAKVKKLLKFGLTINSLDYKQRLPLHYSCKKGNLNLAALLLECGSEAHSKDLNDLSPLSYGLSKGHSDLSTVF